MLQNTIITSISSYELFILKWMKNGLFKLTNREEKEKIVIMRITTIGSDV